MTTRRFLLAVLACVGAAALSLLLADEPVYDAWAWLAWGRELGHLTLDTASGPSWKPLPVAITTVLSIAGDAAPQLWLVVVRAAWLLSLLLAAQIADELAAGRRRGPRLAAAAFAALALALLADDVTAWARQAAGGMSEPLLVALVLGAVRAGIGGATRIALVLGALAALVRPEAWPLLALYGAWCWRTEPRSRALAVALVLAVPALWLAPAVVGSGGGGAERAQRATSNPAEVLWRALLLPPAVAWPLALIALRARARVPAARVLAAAALAWIALVAAMTTIGFPGLPRFMAPAAAIVCVLGASGLAALLERPRASNAALAAVLLALVLTAAGLHGRIADVPRAWRSSARIADSHDRLRALARGVGRARLLACGRLATSDVLVRTALAYELGVPLSRVVSFGTRPRLSGAFVTGLQAPPGLRVDVADAATLVAHDGEWRVYSLRCPATASASAARSAGVSGTTR